MRIARINLDALADNIRTIASMESLNELMVVVKANAYGHGAVPVARAAVAAGADSLGVADITEALELRDAGIDAPILAWLHETDSDFAAGISRDIILGVSNLSQLGQIVEVAEALSRVALIHLEFDSGLSRGGAAPEEWSELCREARKAEVAGRVVVDGIFSHLANSSSAENDLQEQLFHEAVSTARDLGLNPRVVHLPSSEGVLAHTNTYGDAARIGISAYGLTPLDAHTPSSTWNLTPVMTLSAPIALIRNVESGAGASYGFDWRAERPSTLALVPLGYADGLPRAASGKAWVAVHGEKAPIVGRISMDQVIVDVTGLDVSVGDEVFFWGNGSHGEPTADDWAAWADTIGYELVSKVGRRVVYQYVGAGA